MALELIDTHAHIYLPEFESDSSEMLQRAKDEGVKHIFMPNIDAESIQPMLNLAAANDFVHPMMGLHPCSVDAGVDKALAVVEQYLHSKEYKWYGIGECGLDYYWDTTFIDQQKHAFEQQILWAKAYKLPLIIHSRNATDDCIELVAKHAGDDLRGIFHCFSGTSEQLDKICALGFFAGIGGVVTYKNGGLDKVLTAAHLPYLVLETDAPYLPPVPFRGKRNEPSYLQYIVAQLAKVIDVPMEEVAKRTSENGCEVFGV